MRRGVPCWYRRPDVGLSGINDAIFVQSAMYSTLKRHFSGKSYYKNVLEMFNEVSFNLFVCLKCDKHLFRLRM